jgi:hypothetical protein
MLFGIYDEKGDPTMKKRLLGPLGLGLLLLAALASAQQGPPGAASSQWEMRVITPKNHPVRELADLLRGVAGAQARVDADEYSQKLIVQTPPERMEQVLQLIQALDVTRAETPQGQYLTCRAYMFELPPKDQNLKPFSVLLEPAHEPAGPLVLDAARGANVQIGTLLQKRMGNDVLCLAIQGWAADDALRQMLAQLPDAEIRELKWDDEAFTAGVPTAQISHLPGPLQDHIYQFLGGTVQTVGYWFGGLSVPGDVEAPIGLWKMQMKTQLGRGADLVLEVRVRREPPIPSLPETQLLSNTVQGKAGRPIIIGYNRESYGTRVMGAMVILLEADTAAPPIDQAKPKQ